MSDLNAAPLAESVIRESRWLSPGEANPSASIVDDLVASGAVPSPLVLAAIEVALEHVSLDEFPDSQEAAAVLRDWLGKFRVSWSPTAPDEIIREALRDCVGDGDGADEKVLADFTASIQAKALRDAADSRDLRGPHGEDDESSLQQWLRARATEIER